MAKVADLNPAELTIVGLQEIAVLLSVKDRTPHAWAFRGLLPDPDFASINGSRAWKRATILRWAAATGRLPESLAGEVPAKLRPVAA